MSAFIQKRKIESNQKRDSIRLGFGSYRLPKSFLIWKIKTEQANEYPNFYNIVYIFIKINYI